MTDPHRNPQTDIAHVIKAASNISVAHPWSPKFIISKKFTVLLHRRQRAYQGGVTAGCLVLLAPAGRDFFLVLFNVLQFRMLRA